MMIDYEKAYISAYNAIFPHARLSGCYFLPVSDVIKGFETLSLNLDDEFHDVIHYSKSNFGICTLEPLNCRCTPTIQLKLLIVA